MKIVLVTGGFDPLHSGHIEYFKAAKQLGNLLVVGINSDDWLVRKKGKAFMPVLERKTIIENLYQVHRVIEFNDSDDSAIDAINIVKTMYPNTTVVFANGGDRTPNNIPEMSVEDVEFVFGVGGENKINSSSWILQEWKAPKTERSWGYYRVLHEVPGMKVKELTVNPGQQLSMQRHTARKEYWIVSEGSAIVNSKLFGGYSMPSRTITEHDQYTVPKHEWHQLTNPFDVPCKIVEIQYGEACDESDIERQ